MRDLNGLIEPSLGYWLDEARAINESGQIAANAVTPDGFLHAVLLTPVPEPFSGLLLFVGALAFIGARPRCTRLSSTV